MVRSQLVTPLACATAITCARARPSSQVPQFILESFIDAGRGGLASIVCTQPRRISATSVAQRVADERCESLGSTVGYHIRLESRSSESTRLLFCTTGVLLRRLVDNPALAGVTHVIGETPSLTLAPSFMHPLCSHTSYTRTRLSRTQARASHAQPRPPPLARRSR